MGDNSRHRDKHNNLSPKHRNKKSTTRDYESCVPVAQDRKSSSSKSPHEQKRSFLRSPFSRRKKDNSSSSEADNPPYYQVLKVRQVKDTSAISKPPKDKTNRDKPIKDKLGKDRATGNGNATNRIITRTPNPGYRTTESPKSPKNFVPRHRRTSSTCSSSSNSSASGFQYPPRDAAKSSGHQRRGEGSLMPTSHRSASSTHSTPSPSRHRKDNRSISGSRIPGYNSRRTRTSSQSGSESEPGVAIEIPPEQLSEYRAKAIRGGGGKIPPNHKQFFQTPTVGTQLLMTGSTSSLPSEIHTHINALHSPQTQYRLLSESDKNKSNSLPNAQAQKVKNQHQNNNIAIRRRSREGKVPSPINTNPNVRIRSTESSPRSPRSPGLAGSYDYYSKDTRSPDAISVKSSSSHRSRKSSSGSQQSLFITGRSHSGSQSGSPSGSIISVIPQKRPTPTHSMDNVSHLNTQAGSRKQQYIEPYAEIDIASKRMSMVEYAPPTVTLEYRTIVRSDSGVESDSRDRNSDPISGNNVVKVAAASCQTDENVTGLGLRGEDLAEISTNNSTEVGYNPMSPKSMSRVGQEFAHLLGRLSCISWDGPSYATWVASSRVRKCARLLPVTV